MHREETSGINEPMTTVVNDGRRRRKLIGRRPIVEEPAVDLSEHAHAWWSERAAEELQDPLRTHRVVEDVVEEPEPLADDGFPSFFSGDNPFEPTPEPEAAAEPEAEPVEDPGFIPRAGYVPHQPLITLGLEHGATWNEIVAAHRKLAKMFHPDVIGVADGGETMREVNQAYATLRAVYER